MGRSSFLVSFDVFLLLVLAIALFAATASLSSASRAFEERLRTSARTDLLYDLLAAWRADGRIYTILSPGGSSFYVPELSAVERETGRKMCLFLDGVPLYREHCQPLSCAHGFVAAGTALGTVEFRKAEVCFSAG